MRKSSKKMTPLGLEINALLKEMRVALAFKDRSESTMSAYTEAVRLLSVHYLRSAAELSEAEVRAYLLYLVDERQLASSTINQRLCGIRFLYKDMLKREYPVFEEFKNRKRQNKIPVCLTHEEVKRVLAAVRSDEYRTALTLAYCCGLRVSELCAVQIDHVMTGQGMLLVRGKGDVQRTMPLPLRALELMRENYTESRPPRPWMFGNGDNSGPMVIGTVQRVLKRAVRSCGANDATSVHTLRHSYATTLLRKGVDITTIQRWMGHKSVQTTMIYLHVVEQAAGDYQKIVNETMSDL